MPGFKHGQSFIEDLPDLTNHVAIVTGGNSGIGFETSLQLARCHARVYIGGRSNKRLQEAIASMRSSAAPGQALDLHPLQFDLADLQSVKAAAELFQQKESKLHLLINNAGVMAVPYKLTVNGFEEHWQINHLAPHLLFTSLLPIMRSTAASCDSKDAVRVVNVSSNAAFMSGPKELDFVDPNLESARGAMACWRRYGHSKHASIVHARAIHNRYSREGVLAFSVHPGISKTNLQAADPTFIGTLIRTMVRVLPFVAPLDAARTTIFCATSPDAPAHSGGFFMPYGKLDHHPDKWTNNEKTVTELWDQSERMLREAGFRK